MSTPLLPFYWFLGLVCGILGASALVAHCFIAYKRFTKGK